MGQFGFNSNPFSFRGGERGGEGRRVLAEKILRYERVKGRYRRGSVYYIVVMERKGVKREGGRGGRGRRRNILGPAGAVGTSGLVWTGKGLQKQTWPDELPFISLLCCEGRGRLKVEIPRKATLKLQVGEKLKNSHKGTK